MVGYKKQQRLFNKLLKKSKKKRMSRKKYNKTRKNKKMRGGGEIQIITENSSETEFEQRDAVINYGSASISTYNLINCIAIGGVFEIDGQQGTFLTHESPLDYQEQRKKLSEIKSILEEKNAKIYKIVLFRIDNPAKDVYKNGLTTEDIIKFQIEFSNKLFGVNSDVHIYSCDDTTYRCGKAIISPTQYTSTLIPIRGSKEKQSVDTKPKEMFIVDVEHDKDGDKIYKCPLCNSLTGTAAVQNPNDTSLFQHAFDCPNKNKIPVEK
uniref:Uncharacterized protein n=1 Tax=viral metagenome TaxID=1070528 RepID=A0A6C0E3U9_9ZZZZ